VGKTVVVGANVVVGAGVAAMLADPPWLQAGISVLAGLLEEPGASAQAHPLLQSQRAQSPELTSITETVPHQSTLLFRAVVQSLYHKLVLLYKKGKTQLEPVFVSQHSSSTGAGVGAGVAAAGGAGAGVGELLAPPHVHVAQLH